MDFTELYKQSSGLCTFSPDGRYLATSVAHRLVIRDADSLQILHLYAATETIDHVSWSPSSELVLCASFKLGLIQIWNVQDEHWTAKIEEGVAGLVSVRWAPDSRHVLAFSDFQLRITVWSLITKEATYLQFPKYTDRGFAFRSDGRYFALAERTESKDFVSIYDCEDWTLLKRFMLDTTDMEDLAWSPDGRFVAVWETSLKYGIYIYYADGRRVSSYSAYESGLGIKSVTWSPSSQFLAIGSFDQKVRFLNHYTWRPLIEFSHPKELTAPDIAVFKEINPAKDPSMAGISSWSQVALPKMRYSFLHPPMTLPQVRADPDKPNPRVGVSSALFSADGALMLTQNDNMPTCLWIWDMTELCQVALIHQSSPIRSVTWNPVIPGLLAFCTGNGFIYIWRGGEVNGCELVEVPAVQFTVTDVKWNPNGRGLVLLDKDKFCVGFPVDE
ncbi:hypothetical protein DFS34DRAFT_627591 [Phlyctochytrium arcticum]|nr:hypothetical protein DFS34DRAFT_627591 [Phlyctochytrium arcticum]